MGTEHGRSTRVPTSTAAVISSTAHPRPIIRQIMPDIASMVSRRLFSVSGRLHVASQASLQNLAIWSGRLNLRHSGGGQPCFLHLHVCESRKAEQNGDSACSKPAPSESSANLIPSEEVSLDYRGCGGTARKRSGCRIWNRGVSLQNRSQRRQNSGKSGVLRQVEPRRAAPTTHPHRT